MIATTNTTKFDAMGKEALRAECRAAGISYAKLGNNEAMRAALVAAESIKAELKSEAVDEADEADEVVVVAASNPFGALMGKVAPPVFKGTSTKAVDGKVVTATDEKVEKRAYSPRTKKVATPAPVIPRAVTKGRTVEKNRAEANGVVAQSKGSVGAKIWEVLDANPGTLAKDLDALADANGINRTSMHCGYYRYCKFYSVKK